MTVRVRFAPSPTGYLHVGGARTALFNYLFARVHGGSFVLRIEDTDAQRSTAESIEAIVVAMRWLGLHWDEGPGAGGGYGPYLQSERRERYRHHAEAMLAGAQAYRCWCSPEELEARRVAQLARGEAPKYDGRCRRLGEAERAARAAEPGAVRFALDGGGETAWDDAVKGRLSFQNVVLDDFVLLRSDGLPTYNFACVVDDHEMAITHVIRGDDHVSNTPRQVLLYRALGWSAPVFAHVPMILGPDGSRLSKRHGATSVEAYGELGIIAPALANFLALLGWSPGDDRELFSLAELERVFSLERVGSTPAIFNLDKLEWMNGQHLKRLAEPERASLAYDFLARRGVVAGEEGRARVARLVRALGERVRTLADVEALGAFALREPLETEPEAWADVLARDDVAARLEALAARIEVAEFTPAATEAATRGLAAERGIKPGELMAAARVALTGRKMSPGLFDVMDVLGRDRTLARLRDAARRWSEARAPSGR